MKVIPSLIEGSHATVCRGSHRCYMIYMSCSRNKFLPCIIYVYPINFDNICVAVTNISLRKIVRFDNTVIFFDALEGSKVQLLCIHKSSCYFGIFDSSTKYVLYAPCTTSKTYPNFSHDHVVANGNISFFLRLTFCCRRYFHITNHVLTFIHNSHANAINIFKKVTDFLFSGCHDTETWKSNLRWLL